MCFTCKQALFPKYIDSTLLKYHISIKKLQVSNSSSVSKRQTNIGVPICSNDCVFVWRRRVTADIHIHLLQKHSYKMLAVVTLLAFGVSNSYMCIFTVSFGSFQLVNSLRDCAKCAFWLVALPPPPPPLNNNTSLASKFHDDRVNFPNYGEGRRGGEGGFWSPGTPKNARAIESFSWSFEDMFYTFYPCKITFISSLD